jgi:hypothetical protein
MPTNKPIIPPRREEKSFIRKRTCETKSLDRMDNGCEYLLSDVRKTMADNTSEDRDQPIII